MTQAQERDRLGEGKQCGEPLATGAVAPCLASGRYASCDAAALALVRHLVLEHSKAALAELCDTTSLHRLCISSLKFDRSLEFRRSLHGQIGGLLILRRVADIGGGTPIRVRRARPMRSIAGATLLPLT
jgi:hypothetical protein